MEQKKQSESDKMNKTTREKMSIINQAVESYRKVPDSIGRIFTNL